jgi:oligopeptidase B
MIRSFSLPAVVAAFTFALALSGCKDTAMSDSSAPSLKASDYPAPPVAAVEPHETAIHDTVLVDNYFWMRLSDEQKEAEKPDAQTQRVLDYLNAENAYTDTVMAATRTFQDTLFNEIVGRIKQDDSSVPVKDNGYWYYTRYEQGKEYPIYCRRAGTMEAPEEIMLDVNAMAEGYSYYAVAGTTVSPDNRLLVFGVDTVSRREYTLYVKDLATGAISTESIPVTEGGATWANDSKTFFYTKKDPITLRSYRVYKHVLGTAATADPLVYEESDETFSVGVGKTKSDRFLIIASNSTVSSEWHFLDANTPNGKWQVIEPRQRDLEYAVDHYGDDFYIVTNRNAKNFKLVKTPVTKPGMSNWVDVIAHRNETLLEGIEIFKDHLIVEERTGGLTQLRVKRWDGSADWYVEFNDPAYTAYVGANPDFDAPKLRFGYTSLTTPTSTFEIDLESKAQDLLKQQEVVGGTFRPEDYVSERLLVKAADGTEVPVSLVYRKDNAKSADNPLLLYAYGSYGYSTDPSFSSTRLSLLDRGFVFAIAHIRGGQEMGRAWYENGKLFNKKNTFTDYIDCGQALVDLGYTSPDHLYGMGGSAGGLLMGAVMNMAPELFNGIISAVPFVDVINTMLDETIPLTTGEFDEWGNPKDKAYFDYMLSYSPYDNVRAMDYPHTLVTTGYWDSQVQYWEPAKWVAKLRAHKTDDNLLLLHCNMETGHGGASGRFKRFRETAMEYAFLLMLEGTVS